MQRYAVLGVAVLAVSFFVLPSQASAQSLFLGGGGTFPTGDYGEYAKTGWMVEGGLGFGVGDGGWILFAEGLYGSNTHEGAEIQTTSDAEDKTNLLGGFFGVEYDFADPGDAGPFIFAEVGVLKHDYEPAVEEYSESDTGFAFGGGAGYSFPIGSVKGWVLGRYLQGQFDEDDGNTAFFGLSAGVSIPLRGE